MIIKKIKNRIIVMDDDDSIIFNMLNNHSAINNIFNVILGNIVRYCELNNKNTPKYIFSFIKWWGDQPSCKTAQETFNVIKNYKWLGKYLYDIEKYMLLL